MEENQQSFRLEFSEEQQSFHMAYLDEKENTNGYVTIFNTCTEYEKNILKAYLLKNKSKSLSISSEHRIALTDVFEAVNDLRAKFKKV